jgi:hypothetical protein
MTILPSRLTSSSGNNVAERFGGQKELELVVPTPSVIPPSPNDDSLLALAKKLAWTEEDDKEAAN